MSGRGRRATAWTPAKRQQARERALARLGHQRERFAENHPEFVATYHAAMLEPESCDTCGSEARPMVHWLSGVLLGWRCYACRVNPW